MCANSVSWRAGLQGGPARQPRAAPTAELRASPSLVIWSIKTHTEPKCAACSSVCRPTTLMSRMQTFLPPIKAPGCWVLIPRYLESGHRAVSVLEAARAPKPAAPGSLEGSAAMAGSGGGTLLSLATKQRLLVRSWARVAGPTRAPLSCRDRAAARCFDRSTEAAGAVPAGRQQVAGGGGGDGPAAARSWCTPATPAWPSLASSQDEMLGSVRDAAGGAWSVLVLDPTTTKVRRLGLPGRVHLPLVCCWPHAAQLPAVCSFCPTMPAMLGQQVLSNVAGVADIMDYGVSRELL